MPAQDDLKLKLMNAILDWVREQHLSQREAARRLNVEQPVVCGIMKGQCRYGVGWLLDAWQASGGSYEVTLGRTDEA